MPIDSKEIKLALDDFEKDDFMGAKDRIKAQVQGAVTDYYKTKLELQKDLEPKAGGETDGGTDNGTDGGTDSGTDGTDGGTDGGSED